MGGLAYDLTTKLCAGFMDWNVLFTNAPNQLAEGNFMVERWLGINLFELTTGNSCFDVRIRGSAYINDNYLIYGSYRAEFRDLYGVGNNGIAGMVSLWLSQHGISTLGSPQDFRRMLNGNKIMDIIFIRVGCLTH